MRIFAAVALAISVLASSAFAAGTEVRAPLVPGKPATVKKAQLEGNTIMIVAGVAIVAGGIALVASEGNDTVVPATTSSTTTGTP
jgi:hypothetical protein